MKRNIKLLTSIVMLSITLITFITSIFGWYTTNKEATASGIIGSTNDPNIDYTLEAYDSTSNSYSDTKTMSFSNIKPGDTFYFRFKIAPHDTSLDVSALKFDITFTSFTSSLQENTLTYDNTNNIITYDSVKLYSVTNNEVTFDDKTLYKISDSSILLGDYEIKDTFKVYPNIKKSDALTADTGTLLTEVLSTYKEDTNYIAQENDNYYFYFALEFNEALSLVTDNGVESSNAYEFQKLDIEAITIKRVM